MVERVGGGFSPGLSAQDLEDRGMGRGGRGVLSLADRREEDQGRLAPQSCGIFCLYASADNHRSARHAEISPGSNFKIIFLYLLLN